MELCIHVVVPVCALDLEDGEVKEGPGSSSSTAAAAAPSSAPRVVPASSVPGAPCPALVLLLRQYARAPGGACSVGFSLQAEALIASCASRLRQQRLYQQQQQQQ
jgi:hypothetical protein